MKHLKSFIFLAVVLAVIFMQVSCSQPQNYANLGRIVISVTFPEQTRIIPAGTDYIEVAVKGQNSSSWTTKSLEGLPGESATVTFEVPGGVYDIHVMAKDKGKYSPDYDELLAAGKTEGVQVVEGETTIATITLFPLQWTFGTSPTEIYEGDNFTLEATLVAPRDFVKDYLGDYSVLRGSLKDAISPRGECHFSRTVVSTTEATSLIRYTSRDTFVAPQVDNDTTYTWQILQSLTAYKWTRGLAMSPQNQITIKNRETPGSLVIIIK